MGKSPWVSRGFSFWPRSFLHRALQIAAITVILMSGGLSGCAGLMGGNFADNGLGDQCRKCRTADADGQLDGASAKSRQIEKDLGCN
jgi:hypothetical protein